MITLYPFQAEIINRLRASLLAGNKSPMVVSPTGSGKTIMFGWLASQLMNSRK
ncbi:MAG: DEAD/DEAH box helicase family protein, partial [Candidatus Marinimicrobia bacterium]|nr:DEAD/DEAH box helicase family protein [Candidatus Neomarinimicrobiota bacterium]